jgi:hypothetical protein
MGFGFSAYSGMSCIGQMNAICVRQALMAKMLANWSLEWTSASWPRYAACQFSAARGQLASAPQLQR